MAFSSTRNAAPHRRPPPPPPPPKGSTASMHPAKHTPTVENGGNRPPTNAAADLIRTLDSAFAEMSSLSSSAAKDVEDARRNARAASEVARRYTARSYPQNLIMQSSSASKSSTGAISPARKRKISKPPSSSERLAQSHAEDALALSLDLERTKQELTHERMEHDQTRMNLTEYRTKNSQLEAQIEKLLGDIKKQGEDRGRFVVELKRELEDAKARADAADEDAQAALDLAKESANSRDQLEAWLQKALEELAVLREQLEQSRVEEHLTETTKPVSYKKNSVRFAEQPTVVTLHEGDGAMIISASQQSATPSTPSRAMVNAGRRLLVGSAGHESNVHTITFSPEASAERRRQLRERLKALYEDDTLVSSPSPVSKAPPRIEPTIDQKVSQRAVETCHSVANILRESARKLELSGRWGPGSKQDDATNVENIARRYCNSVEIKIQHHDSEVKQINSLCSYLEEQLSLTNGRT